MKILDPKIMTKNPEHIYIVHRSPGKAQFILR